MFSLESGSQKQKLPHQKVRYVYSVFISLSWCVIMTNLVLISLIKLGCRERSPGATVGPRDFVDGSIRRARDGNS